jgi:hypothetical protein
MLVALDIGTRSQRVWYIFFLFFIGDTLVVFVCVRNSRWFFIPRLFNIKLSSIESQNLCSWPRIGSNVLIVAGFGWSQFSVWIWHPDSHFIPVL